MIPHQRRWERPDDSQALIPNSRLGNLPAGPQAQCKALGISRLTWRSGRPFAHGSEPAAGLVQSSSKEMPRHSFPLVVAIDTESDAEPLASMLDSLDATKSWIHVRAPRPGIWHKRDTTDLWKTVANTAAERGARTNQLYLFAAGPSAETALRWLALQPAKFSGIGIFNGSCPDLQSVFAPAFRLTHRAFLAASIGSSSVCETLELSRLLRSTGMNVTTRLCASLPHEDGLPSTKIQDFVRWTQRFNS